MKNQGLHQHRFPDNPEEQRFAKHWETYNDRFPGTLDYLLSKDNRPAVEASDRDREVAATVIQWLGSPVGQGFLRERGYVSRRAVRPK
jgi:hypothetical protein